MESKFTELLHNLDLKTAVVVTGAGIGGVYLLGDPLLWLIEQMPVTKGFLGFTNELLAGALLLLAFATPYISFIVALADQFTKDWFWADRLKLIATFLVGPTILFFWWWTTIGF